MLCRWRPRPRARNRPGYGRCRLRAASDEGLPDTTPVRATWRTGSVALKTGHGDARKGNPGPQGLDGPTSYHGTRAPARSARPARTGRAAIVGLAPDGVGTVVVRFGDVPVVVVCVVVVAEVVVAVIVEVVAAAMTAQAIPTPLASKTARTRPTTSAFVRPVVTKTPPLRAQPPEVL
mmetsp:Transcript_21440/g.67740  ORF Transcript_21440/g.67740 Transcript_21440/m.67740 type:complete len:177 (+) Transcript_21440:313-843(+)